jgi:hypothetical protein
MLSDVTQKAGFVTQPSLFFKKNTKNRDELNIKQNIYTRTYEEGPRL